MGQVTGLINLDQLGSRHNSFVPKNRKSIGYKFLSFFPTSLPFSLVLISSSVSFNIVGGEKDSGISLEPPPDQLFLEAIRISLKLLLKFV